ncbi:MAG: hypothetical protein IJ838_03240 [Paludibacteraceae bacterium]|nr:hypothetical protein [Paludibacteraceae bacterium]
MRKRLSLFALVWLISLMGAMADDVLMPQFGSQVITVGSTPITFYDMKGAEDISSSSSNNSFATTIFKPEIAGQSIKITFTTIDVRNDGSSWPARLYVYNGVFDTESVTYPTSTSEVIASSAFPSTDKLLNSYDGTYSNIEFISGDATGALSVCYVYRDAKACSGWVATVSAVTLAPMTVESAAANYDFVDTEVWAGKQDVGMAGMTITTEGYSSPDQLQSLTFTANSTGVIDPTALQLYAAQAASAAGMTALAGTFTESAGVYTYTLTEPYALSNGNNKFMLAGDILSSAAFNATAQVNVTGITTVGGFTSFTTATPATLTVAAMYLMAERCILHGERLC